MAGVRQFNEAKALDRAVRAFWERGYAATSMDDLARATGVARGSLYNAYGGKDGLLAAALDHYATTIAAPAVEALADPDPRRAVERLFDAHLARMADPANPGGCLSTAMCLECGGQGTAGARRAADQLRAAETAVYAVLRRGQAEGRLDAGRDPRALARFIVGATRGMAVVHRATGDLEAARDIARVALSALDGPGA